MLAAQSASDAFDLIRWPAVQTSYTEVVKALIDAGADITQRNGVSL